MNMKTKEECICKNRIIDVFLEIRLDVMESSSLYKEQRISYLSGGNEMINITFAILND